MSDPLPRSPGRPPAPLGMPSPGVPDPMGLDAHGVNTNGAAAKVMILDRLGEKDTPWHFGEGKSYLAGVPKKSLCQKTHKICSDPPLVLTPCVPFRLLPIAEHHIQGQPGTYGARRHISYIIFKYDIV